MINFGINWSKEYSNFIIGIYCDGNNNTYTSPEIISIIRYKCDGLKLYCSYTTYSYGTTVNWYEDHTESSIGVGTSSSVVNLIAGGYPNIKFSVNSYYRCVLAAWN